MSYGDGSQLQTGTFKARRIGDEGVMGTVSLPPQVQGLVRRFFILLAADDYGGLAAEDRFSGLDADRIRAVLEEYPGCGTPGHPTVPPDQEIESPSFAIELSSPVAKHGGWALDVRMYFDGVRSDLTLQCNVYREEAGGLSLEVIDLHEL